MVSAWRLTKTKHLATAWDGEGAKRNGGRWNSPGVAVVYASGSLSLALVEVLVHLSSEILDAYSGIPLEFDESLLTEVRKDALPDNWRDHPGPPDTRAMGDRWAVDQVSAALRVPSAVVPHEFHYLLNPFHTDFARVAIGAASPFPFDPRLKRS